VDLRLCLFQQGRRTVLRLLSFPMETCDKSEREETRLVPYGTYIDVPITLAATLPLLHGARKTIPVFVFFPMPPSRSMCLLTLSPFCIPVFPSTAAYIFIDHV
jgi:hypothetical protein